MPKRKKGNPRLWSVPRVTDPRYPGLTVRITELRSGGTLYAVHMKARKQKMASLRCTRRDLLEELKSRGATPVGELSEAE